MAKIEIEKLLNDIYTEVKEAKEKYPTYNSAHEGYGLLLEEVDELKEEVFLKQDQRSIARMKKEAIQIAAVALRIALEVCNEEVGRR